MDYCGMNYPDLWYELPNSWNLAQGLRYHIVILQPNKRNKTNKTNEL